MSAEAIRQKLLARFREVAADRVERLASALHQLEGGAGQEPLEELARELHTLKGEARMMGFTAVSALVHAAEEVLGAGLHGSRERIAGMRRACEAIPELLEGPPSGGEREEALLADLRRLIEEQTTEIPDNKALPAKASGPTAPAPAQAKAASSIRVDLDALDEIAGLAGDVLVEGAKAAARTKELKGLLQSWTLLADKLVAAAEASRVPGLVDEVEGEVHRLRSEAFRFFHHHAESVGGVQRQLSSLAERVATARLIPLSGVFANLPEAAAGLAREQHKEIVCTVAGGETGIDKAILPSLHDPLVHLVRNAIDHGLEVPDDRARAGKPRAGTLAISARPDGDRLLVEIRDDGKGIDPAAVKAAAVRKGLLDATDAAGLSDRAALELVFAPGLSTRASATETSGRGVGLDVVRKKVVSLGGSVEIDSTPGVGTRFVLRLPQSLSLMKVLLVRIDEDVYGLPSADVEAVGRLEPSELTEIAGIRAVRHRGRLLPVVAAGPLLSLNGGPRETRPAVAFVRQGNEGVALVVDGFRGEREVAVKAPGAFLKGMRFVSGAAALEDGRVALLLSSADLVAAARAMGATAPVRSRSRKRILLVDDSLIARETEAVLLRALGHELDEAADGEEAWQKLQTQTYDILVTDVQMPVLDGIELTRRVKSSPKHRRLPVLVLSSLSSPQDRRRGVEAGADAWLSKAELDADRLAAALERLCGTGS